MRIDRRTVLAGALGLLWSPAASFGQARIRIAPAGGGGGGGSRMADWGGTAYQTLEITNPHGTQPSAHRTKHAYTGLLYEIPIGVIGGVYPYFFEISSGAGAGMTINAVTGILSWPNPQSNATPTVRVTDTLGTQRTISWTITVGTSGFKFIDGVNGTVNGSGGTGTDANPWRTTEDVVEHSAATDICYFKTATYNYAGIDRGAAEVPDENESGWYIEVGPDGNNASSAMWLAYPGHAPVFDHTYNGTINTAYMFENWGDGTSWFEGVAFDDCYWKFIGNKGGQVIYWRCAFTGQNVLKSNACMMMWDNNTDTSRCVVKDCTFNNSTATSIPGDGLGILSYDMDKPLIEGCTFTSLDGGWSPKADISNFTFRGNTVRDCEHILSSNMNQGNGKTSSGDWCFNNFDGPFDDANEWGFEIGTGWIATVGEHRIYRNTFRARLTFGHFGTPSRPAVTDGPFIYDKNVFVNEDTSAPAGAPGGFTHFHELSFSTGVAWTRVTATNNLKGNAAAGLIDANGLLTGAARTANGPGAAAANQRGHELPP